MWSAVIPEEKGLPPDWRRALVERGVPRTSDGNEALMKIGMPVGGVCCGLVYLGGDGKLWYWDIFNRYLSGVQPRRIHYKGRSWHGLPPGLAAWQGGNYVDPVTTQPCPFEQGFALRVTVGGKTELRTLDREGWRKVSFGGSYPVGTVRYSDPDCPVKVVLEAFSPYCPLDFDESSYPAVVMRYTVENAGAEELRVELGGWLENAVLRDSGPHCPGVRLRNAVTAGPDHTMLECSAILTEGVSKARADITAEDLGHEFVVERNLIRFLIGGGDHPGHRCLNLVVDGKVLRSATGHNGRNLRAEWFDVREFVGRSARLEIVNELTNVPGGGVLVERVVFTDVLVPDECHDWGSMALVSIGPDGCVGSAELPEASAAGLFATGAGAEATAPVGEPLIGGITRTLVLAPGESGTLEFVVAWHFTKLPNLARGSETGAYYGRRFDNAAAVAAHLAARAKPLRDQTMLWRDTWYDSTLPYWFLDRIFIPLDCLASTTCYRFADGRFYTFEGVRSCEGHPNHVWHYAQGHARIFPELEQDVIERVWYGFAFRDDGSMDFRGEHEVGSAIDGHCGVILSVLRAHQMNPDDRFLRRIWPKVKKSVEYAMACDRDQDGLPDTPMLTTLDEPWHGRIPWIGSLYLAALKAAEQMAAEMGDGAFAETCREQAASGRATMDSELFNGEWFVQLPDPENPDKLGAYETCHIDQVMGQGWAWQLGLGRVLNESSTRSALRSIWKYNFARSLDAYDRQADPKGRPYFTDGEGGLVMTANVLGRKLPFGVYSMFACYLSETMNGFEYQAAAHMIAEGMVEEGLAVIRTVDERYDAGKRNPFNEVECGDHYARSMAGYGALIAISGFEHHGPRGHIGFAPRLTPENFRVPFTAAEGWGTYGQEILMSGDVKRQPELKSRIMVKHGRLRVKTISLAAAADTPGAVSVEADGRQVASRFGLDDGRLLIRLEEEVVIAAGGKLEIVAG